MNWYSSCNIRQYEVSFAKKINIWQRILGLLAEAEEAINTCWQYLPTYSTAKCEFAGMYQLF